MNSFVTVLIQSATFGTSIADALRVYAGEMRDKRVMRAEEKANTLPTKLTLATMMLTVPPLLIILIGPSVYGIYDTFRTCRPRRGRQVIARFVWGLGLVSLLAACQQTGGVGASDDPMAPPGLDTDAEVVDPLLVATG